jgi:hypothetical protein
VFFRTDLVGKGVLTMIWRDGSRSNSVPSTMRRSHLAVLSTVALAAVPAALPAVAPAATPSGTRTCETFDRFLQQLTVKGVTCPGGRKVIHSWARSSRCIPEGDGFIGDRARYCTVRGFGCKPRKAEGGVRVTCKSQGRVIRFFDSQG